MSVESKYPYTVTEDAMLEKDWGSGTKIQIESKEFIIRKVGNAYKGEYMTIKYPPALWKIIDEIIVNALDHFIRCLNTSAPVTYIKVNIAPEDGRIRVTNSGPGIEIEQHKVASEQLGRIIWVPTLIFSVPWNGMNRYQADDSIVGGTNGLGSKLTNVFSAEFVVETVSGGKYFLQRWRNNKRDEEPPKIFPIDQLVGKMPADRLAPHTTVSFVPNYIGTFSYEKFDSKLYEMLCDIVRTRVFFAAAYVNYTKCGSAEMWFNDERINPKSIADIAKLCFPTDQMFYTTITPNMANASRPAAAYHYPWEVCVVLTNSTIYGAPHIGNVNGIMVGEGKHYKHILGCIVEGVKENVSKILCDKNLKFSPSLVTNNIFLFLNTKIPKPSWTGQRKDVLGVEITRFAHYSLDTKFTGKIAEQLHDRILSNVLENIEVATGRKKQCKTSYDKYLPAHRAGTKYSQKCSLIAVEGDSAMTQVATGIASTKVLGWEYYGAISLGGVIMNVRKECKRTETEDKVYVKKTTKLKNNIFMKVLMEVTGLNTAYKYEPGSPTYKKEMAELNYGSLIACVDQDLDGKGNILGLLLNTFELFWPRLLAAGYVKWFCTPIIRAYPLKDSKVLEFYSQNEYDTWKKTADVSRYDIRYYKGLGTHDRAETLRMFSKFIENVHAYFTDEQSREFFDIYFGKHPDLRKRELSRPITDVDIYALELQQKNHKISCTDHLRTETFFYQKDNLSRKLDHVIDGQNQAGRKILNGILKALKKTNKSSKVVQLAGYISEHESYHHGEESLATSIAGKAFIAAGGKQLPFLVPLSQFGSRLGGGGDAAKPRYIFAKLNYRIVDLLFPRDDYHILRFNFDEGKRTEPEYFVPTIPIVIAESTEIPSHGWKLKLWARDVFKIIENVRRLIRYSDNIALLHMPATTYKGSAYEWRGQFKTIRGEPYSFGKYTIDEQKNVLNIIELPLRVWTNQYVAQIKKKMAADNGRIIASVTNESDDLTVNIKIELRPDALTLLDDLGDSCYTDGVEEYFQLRQHMDSHINLTGVNNEILSFKDYESVMYEWFPVRKEYYGKRIDRTKILMMLTICKFKNIVRYIEESNSFPFAKQKKIVMESTLADAKYDKIDIGLLTSPKFTPTEDLQRLIMCGDGANFDYLLKLSDLKKSSEALELRRADLAAAITDLESFCALAGQGRFPGAAIWERELDQLAANISEGQRTFWRYGETDKYTFD